MSLVLIAILSIGVAGAATGAAVETAGRDNRAFDFAYRCIIEAVPEGAKEIRIWMPVPASGEDQAVADLRTRSPVEAKIATDPEYGNTILFVALEASRAVGAEIGYTCSVVRREVVPPEPGRAEADPLWIARSLRADRLVPTEGRPVEIAALVASDRSSADEKARAYYDWILREMTYDKSGTGWGRGDFNHACDIKKGNCTDFHSYFIGLARASGVPAVFEMGFPLPVGRGEGMIAGYHCWAKFYTEGKGWTGVDISEADKDPSMAEYFFGRLTPDRVMLSRGRDLVLVPPQAGEPLNFFIYPYVEADGEPIERVRREATFRDRKTASE